MQKKYFIKTYGCQMNVHESEKLAGMLKTLDYTETADFNSADVILFNTCCIREGAEQKLFGNVGALKNLKAKRPNLIVGVCGCMTQQPEVSERLMKKFPFIDIVFGTQNLFKFKTFLSDFLENKKRIKEIENNSAMPDEVEIYRTSGQNAYINIMYGCNNFCTYCIVPHVRGRERSRDFNAIVTEAHELIKSGKYKFLTLLGQNVNSYGKDLDIVQKHTFAELLSAICAIPGDFKLKFMTSHPKDLTDEVIKAIAGSPKISNALHLPVQSGSTSILKAMNRKYSREDYLNLIAKIRQSIPGVTISTDIIVGFPGESEQDFNDTLTLVQEVGFEAVFAFMYSKRRGTPAESMPNQIDIAVKRRRVNEVLKIVKEAQAARPPKLIGKKFNVLVENSKASDEYICKTDCQKTVHIHANNLRLGTFIDIIITEYKNKVLYGKVAE